jgi:hypothetical protein
LVSEGLELLNIMIKDAVHQEELIKWKVQNFGKRSHGDTGRIGPNYWRSFLRHHPLLHENKHANFDQKKDAFIKLELFQGMYDQIYIKSRYREFSSTQKLEIV